MRGTQCYRLLTWTPARPCYKANLQSTPLANLALTPTLIASCARAQTADGRCAGGWCARARHGGVLAREGHRVLLARGQTADAVVPGGCLRWVNQAATLLPAEAAKCALPGAAPCCCSCEGTRLGGRQPRLTFPHFCRLTVSVPIISPSSPSLSPSFPHFGRPALSLSLHCPLLQASLPTLASSCPARCCRTLTATREQQQQVRSSVVQGSLAACSSVCWHPCALCRPGKGIFEVCPAWMMAVIKMLQHPPSMCKIARRGGSSAFSVSSRHTGRHNGS